MRTANRQLKLPILGGALDTAAVLRGSSRGSKQKIRYQLWFEENSQSYPLFSHLRLLSKRQVTPARLLKT